VTRFGNRVDLDGECYRNTHLAQLAGEFDRLCSAPAVPVDDNGSLHLFKRREGAIVVGIEEANDLMESFLSMVIPEHFRVDCGVAVAKICSELHFGVPCVIPADEAPNKSNNDHVPGSGGNYR
jgi:hypothetical protein